MMAFCFSASFLHGALFFIPFSRITLIARMLACFCRIGCVSVTALQSVPAYDLLYFGACWFALHSRSARLLRLAHLVIQSGALVSLLDVKILIISNLFSWLALCFKAIMSP
ncbi:hypothetical protein ACWIJ6_19960 [Aeromonas piscicola]|jgi:hypothetical protein